MRMCRMQLGQEGLNVQLPHVFLRFALFTNDLIHEAKVCSAVLPEECVAGEKDLSLEEGIELSELAGPIVTRQDSTAIDVLRRRAQAAIECWMGTRLDLLLSFSASCTGSTKSA